MWISSLFQVKRGERVVYSVRRTAYKRGGRCETQHTAACSLDRGKWCKTFSQPRTGLSKAVNRVLYLIASQKRQKKPGKEWFGGLGTLFRAGTVIFPFIQVPSEFREINRKESTLSPYLIIKMSKGQVTNPVSRKSSPRLCYLWPGRQGWHQPAGCPDFRNVPGVRI